MACTVIIATAFVGLVFSAALSANATQNIWSSAGVVFMRLEVALAPIFRDRDVVA